VNIYSAEKNALPFICYDINGNMTLDKNKGITSIEYNYLNLPTKVEFGSSSNRIEWKYAVTGAKLRKTVYTNGTVTSTIDYVSGFVYTSNNLNYTLDYFFTETGRIKRTGTGDLQYEYDIKDHLGNTRISFADLLPTPNQQPDILMESHYYAFGMRIEGLGSKSDNKYLYNGKELTEDFGLNWYEYGWRMYDPQLGRWHAVDPADEYNTPYVFVGNMPTIKIDPDGSFDIFYFEIDGSVTVVPAPGPPRYFVRVPVFFEIAGQKWGDYMWTEYFINDDLLAFARGIYAEFGGRPQIEKETAAEIIDNRKESETYKHTGNTYKGVLEDRKDGVQFSSTIKGNGRYDHYTNPYKITNDDPREFQQFLASVSAAVKIAFGNYNRTNGSLFFYSPLRMEPPFSVPGWVNGKTETTPPGVDPIYMRTYKK